MIDLTGLSDKDATRYMSMRMTGKPTIVSQAQMPESTERVEKIMRKVGMTTMGEIFTINMALKKGIIVLKEDYDKEIENLTGLFG